MLRKSLFALALAGALSASAVAVPVLSGTLNQVIINATTNTFQTTTGTILLAQVGGAAASSNLALVETTAGLPAGTLNSLPGNPYARAGLVFGTFNGGVVGDGIRFTASAALFNSGAATPTFAYFAALDDLTGANPTIFLPLNLTSVAQTFEIMLPAAGNYRFSIGAERTALSAGNLAPPFNFLPATYSTTVSLSGLTGFGTPEIDPRTSSLPLLFCATLVLMVGQRQRHLN